MKKFMFVILMLFTFLFSSNIMFADTILETEETAVGSIKINLKFDHGYVGALDAYIKVNGDVKVDNLIWNNSLGAYIKRYSYDANNKIIRIIISTGDSTRNLLDKYGCLNVGELKISNNTGISQNYSFSIMEASMVDASYKANDNLTVRDGSVSEYIIKVDNNPVTPINPVVPDDKDDDFESNSNRPNNSNDLDDEDEGEDITNNDLDEDNDSIDNSIENNKPTSDKDKDISDKDKNAKPLEDAETHNQKIVKYLWITLGSLIVVAILLAGIYARKQNKLKVQ